MPYIPCPGGLSTMWKTKAKAAAWLKKALDWPCGTSKCSGEEGCIRGAAFTRVKVTKGYLYNAQVWCYCPPPTIGLGHNEPEVITWVPLRRPAKKAKKRTAAK